MSATLPHVDEEVTIRSEGVGLPGHLSVPDGAQGVVVFAHGSGSSRHSPRNRLVARLLEERGLGTLLFDLLTPEEGEDRSKVFDIPLLAARLAGARTWVVERLGVVPIGFFGASTGAAAALWAAGEGADVSAIVSRGGRPDLAIPLLDRVEAPTLLIVGGLDTQVLQMNREAERHLHVEKKLEIVPGATHLFEEPGTLERAGGLAAEWFGRHLRT